MSDEVRGFRIYIPGDGRRITESRDVTLLDSMLLDMAVNTASISLGTVPDTPDAVLATEQPSVHSSTPVLEPTNSCHVDTTSSPERSAATVSQGNSAEMEREPQGVEGLELLGEVYREYSIEGNWYPVPVVVYDTQF
ncbi:hypothetical protein PF005_g20335 [Phytophthora fragariae]|uniref:Uncharacterized protein n=1 Tax=Phytophthora fragariae TaxID=53985 RepID=A0A6A3SMU5_9STRA|nr:hypothetical protein PF003_g2190 [Phytophthora fragariae]KAE8928485.1 hypothetical protein PF009_g21372 [Phytophthora fragariae]KAE8989687.1 hypothetical protein PF011_g18656 [Phytophthora fragariae]KAE9091476.1 hypothetical protein PF007_g18861 [Phytophthora fragariae]KAE9116863.1 hypothetical protein PF006_g18940 [Phytophthora fragariae]